MAKICYADEIKTTEGYILSVDMVRLAFTLRSKNCKQSLINTLSRNKILDSFFLGAEEEAKPIKDANGKRVLAPLAIQKEGEVRQVFDLSSWEEKPYDTKMPFLNVTSYFTQSGFGKYQAMYIIRPAHNAETAITVGVGLLNNEKTKLEGFVEFNPNKSQGEELKWLLNWLNKNCRTISLKRYDMALDIPAISSDITVNRDNRMYTLKSPSFQNRGNDTEYLGRRNERGFFKKYNKLLEREKASNEWGKKYPDIGEPGTEIKGELTRLELTSTETEYEKFISDFPQVYINKTKAIEQTSLLDYLSFEEKAEELKLTRNDKILVKLLQESPHMDDYFKELSYEKRKKLKPLLYGIYQIPVTIREEDFNCIIKNLLGMCHVKNEMLADIKQFNEEQKQKRPS